MSIGTILQMIEYSDLLLDARVYRALMVAATRDVYPIYTCEPLSENQVSLMLAPSGPINA